MLLLWYFRSCTYRGRYDSREQKNCKRARHNESMKHCSIASGAVIDRASAACEPLRRPASGGAASEPRREAKHPPVARPARSRSDSKHCLPFSSCKLVACQYLGNAIKLIPLNFDASTALLGIFSLVPPIRDVSIFLGVLNRSRIGFEDLI